MLEQSTVQSGITMWRALGPTCSGLRQLEAIWLGLQFILWLEPWLWLAIVINYTRLKLRGKQTWKKHLYAQNKSSLTLTKVEERGARL